ncbi:MAG: metallophosphoesterase family protein [Candidatus Omnitrophica bacterium]|nr:metallophosphoesterase family protein [Candidatus Omnitrophota bacterium]
MKIGVLSDTHSNALPKQLLEDFKSVDLIVHAGDICSIGDLKVLQGLADVAAVQGNMDEESIRSVFPKKKFINIEDKVLAIYHGEGPSAKVVDFVKHEFDKEKVDVVVFGHSHRPYNEEFNGVLYFNPGSPNDQVCSPYCSYGILEITKDKISGRIIKIEN